MFRAYDDDDDRQQTAALSYKVPDRDFYRKNFSTFGSVVSYLENKLYVRSFRDRRIMQPHFNSLVNTCIPHKISGNAADGVCTHFLRRGFTKPNKIQFNAAVWSADARWLVLGTQSGDLALWEGEALKVHKVISIPAHKEFFGDGDRVKEQFPITAMAWKNYGNILATGDNRGLIQFCDETFRNVFVTKDAHTAAVRGLSFSPTDSKVASCSDDSKVHIWPMGRDKPEVVLTGHQSDIKCIDWHGYRSLIATGSRDSTVRLWDPRLGGCVSTISGHKKQVNCCEWNINGNWLATGSMDGLVKIYDIRTMKETEVWRGQNSEICKIAWHPIYENLLVSGGYNGSLIYWIAGQNQSPHTMVADAHRQSIDVIAWHPVGHLLATTSHDCILKFWSREAPGSRLEPSVTEASQDNPPQYAYGPIDPDTPSIIPAKTTIVTAGGNAPHGGGHNPIAGPQFGKTTTSESTFHQQKQLRGNNIGAAATSSYYQANSGQQFNTTGIRPPPVARTFPGVQENVGNKRLRNGY